jgi:hypothetical protein
MKARVLGSCVTFNGSYAFLRPIGDYSKDIFAHESELPGGDRVSYSTRHNIWAIYCKNRNGATIQTLASRPRTQRLLGPG